MRKKELLRKGKKSLVAVLAAAVIANSALPGYVLAVESETEMAEAAEKTGEPEKPTEKGTGQASSEDKGSAKDVAAPQVAEQEVKAAVETEKVTEAPKPQAVEVQAEPQMEAPVQTEMPQAEPQTEAPVQTEAVTEAPKEIQTERQTEALQAEPQTEAPVQTEAQTEAPQTEPQTESQTEAPQTECQTEAPQTESQTEHQTEAPQTEAPQTESETEPQTEPVTETETEAESETETETESESETEALSEELQALQDRIDALPTVEEFQEMTDGEKVEDTNFTQEQYDIYMEAQDICDEYDALSEEDQALLDTTKLEALMEYFNEAMTQAADENGLTISASNQDKGPWVIQNKGTKAKPYVVTIDGAVTLNGSGSAVFQIKGSCVQFTGKNGAQITSDQGTLIDISEGSNVTVGAIGMTAKGKEIYIKNAGTLTLAGADMKLIDCDGNNYFVKEHWIVNSGTLTVNGGSYQGSASYAYSGQTGRLVFSGGTIRFLSGVLENISRANGWGMSGADVTVTGGEIKNCGVYAIELKGGSRLHIGKDAKFSGNWEDISIYGDSGQLLPIQIDKGFSGKLSIDMNNFSAGQQVTAASTDTEDPHYQSKLNLVGVGGELAYYSPGRYWYKRYHASHKWNYASNGNTITVTCKLKNGNCPYHDNGAVLSVTATGGTYNGNPYAAVVSNDITVATGAAAVLTYSGTQADGTVYGPTAEAPTNAGSYKATVTLTVDWKEYKAEQSFRITGVSPTVTAPTINKNLVYNGALQDLIIAGSTTFGRMEYSIDGMNWSSAVPQGKDAAAYSIYYRVLGDKEHEGVAATLLKEDVVIAPREAEIIADPAGKTYGESDPQLTWHTEDTVAQSELGEDDITITREAGEDAGTYAITASAKDTANKNYSYTFKTADFTIRQATPAVTLPTIITDLTYNGTAQDLITAGSTTGGTLEYSLDGTNWSEDIPQAKDADTYQIYYRVSGGKNYEDVTAAQLPEDATIAQRPAEIIADPAGKTYGETDPQLTWHTEDTVAQAELGEDDIAITREAGEDAGIYTITASEKDTANKNYSYTFKSAEFTINKAAQQAPAVQTVDETIKGRSDGKLAGLTAAMEYRAESDTSYTAVTGEEVTDLAAGTYYVRYQEDSNHTASLDTTAVIAEGKLAQIILPSDQKGYTLTASREEAAWGEEVLLTLTLAPGYSKTENFALKVNGAAVTLGEDNACTLKDLEADAQITVEGVADITAPQIIGVETDGVYMGSVTFTVEDEYLAQVTVDGEPIFENNGNITFTLIPKTGTYRIEASDASGNTTAAANITVNWKEVQAPDGGSKEYTGEMLISDLTDGTIGEAAYTVTENAGGIDAGTYDVKLTLTDPVNYKWESEEGGKADTVVTFTITPKSIADAEVVLGPSLRANGSEQTQTVEKVVLDGKELPADVYTVENNTAIEAGTYTLTVRAKDGGNYTGEVQKEFEILEAETETETEAPVETETETETPTETETEVPAETETETETSAETETETPAETETETETQKQSETKKQTETNKQTPASGTTPRTGDTTPLAGYAVACILSLAAALLLLGGRKKFRR